MNYEMFIRKNKGSKSKQNPVRILDVSFTANSCSLSDGQTYTIEEVVDGVSKGKVYLSNPSKLTQWKGFDKSNVKVTDSPFTLVEKTSNLVILKVNANNSATVARYPYVNSKMDYISVTRGEQHILTVVNKDGSSFNFSWGIHSRTMISDSLEALKKAVIKFIEEDNHIILRWDDGKVHSAVICFNGNFGMWQLKLEGHRSGKKVYAFVRRKDVKSLEDMIKYSEHFVNAKGWEKGVAETGIDIWTAKLRKTTV